MDEAGVLPISELIVHLTIKRFSECWGVSVEGCGFSMEKTFGFLYLLCTRTLRGI